MKILEADEIAAVSGGVEVVQGQGSWLSDIAGAIRGLFGSTSTPALTANTGVRG